MPSIECQVKIDRRSIYLLHWKRVRHFLLLRAMHNEVDIVHSNYYVCLVQFQSNHLETDFGMYRQMKNGSYFISVEQVLYSLKFQRIKLFGFLEIIF